MAVKVEIFGTSSCKKCFNVRQLLDRKQVEYIDHLTDLMPLEKDEMIRRTGLKYYPQVFVNGEYLGGEEDILQLELDGKLDSLLGLD